MRSRTGSVSRGRRRDGELQSKPIVVLVVHLLICRLGAATEYSDVNPATFNYDDEWQGNLTLQLVPSLRTSDAARFGQHGMPPPAFNDL